MLPVVYKLQNYKFYAKLTNIFRKIVIILTLYVHFARFSYRMCLIFNKYKRSNILSCHFGGQSEEWIFKISRFWKYFKDGWFLHCCLKIELCPHMGRFFLWIMRQSCINPNTASDDLLKELTRNSYEIVKKKYTKKR